MFHCLEIFPSSKLIRLVWNPQKVANKVMWLFHMHSSSLEAETEARAAGRRAKSCTHPSVWGMIKGSECPLLHTLINDTNLKKRFHKCHSDTSELQCAFFLLSQCSPCVHHWDLTNVMHVFSFRVQGWFSFILIIYICDYEQAVLSRHFQTLVRFITTWWVQ